MDLHGGTPYPQALALPMSFADAYFESAVQKQQAKIAEGQQKTALAVIARLDAIIKSFGHLGKALAGRR